MKNILFMLFGYIGVAVIVLSLFLLTLYLLNKSFNIVKYIIMYREYSKNEDLYDIRNNVIISKSGNIRYSCAGNLNEQIEILDKALKHLKDVQKMNDDSQESVLVSSVMDSLKEIEEQDSNNKTVNIEKVKVFDNRH